MSYRKNVALPDLTFGLNNVTTGAAETGGLPVVFVTTDGTQGASTNSAVELANGQYKIAITQAEMNGTEIGIFVTETNSVPHNAYHIHTTVLDVDSLNNFDPANDDVAVVTLVGTVTNLAATAVADIYNALTTTVTLAGSMGKFILDKLGLITANTAITTTLIIDGSTLTIFQGHTFSFTQDAPVASAGDLTGYTGKLAFTKVTANAGTDPLELTIAVTDPNTSTQKFVFAMTSAQSAALALDTARTALQTQDAPAYTFVSAATDGVSDCPAFSRGQASVVASDATC